MKRKKREAFIMAAVAGSFVVSMTGLQDIWALGNNGGRSYKVQTIQDSSTGKTAARGYVPIDYTVSGDVTWCGKWQSASAPAQVYLTAMSADQNTIFGFYSPVSYEHMLDYSMGGVSYNQHQDGGFDAQTMVPMLHFMKAEEYCDYMTENILDGNQAELLSQAEITPSQQKMLDESANLNYQQNQQLVQGSGFQVDGSYSGMAERTYGLTLDQIPFRFTILTTTNGVQLSSTADMIYTTAHTAFVAWESPFTFFMLTPENEYENSYADFEQFVLNTAMTDQFVQAFIDARTQIMQYSGSSSMSQIGDYCQDSVSASIGNDSTYDAERFTDYIYSQNDYTLPDGEHVKIPTSYDYVYADDLGNVYVSNGTHHPAGTTQLYPN